MTKAVEPVSAYQGPDWDRAIEAAAEWSIRLDEEPDDQPLRRAFDVWIAEHPLHRDAWTHVVRTTELIVRTNGLAFLPTGEASSHHTLHRRPSWPVRRVFAAAAAVIALTLLSAPQLAKWLSAEHRTGTAEQRTVTLADGSIVRLAPRSAVSVDYAADERRVSLLSGEAYFDVRPNPSRPFRVSARGTTVTVLGTGFDVRLGGEGQEVAVKHGRVQVLGGGTSATPQLLTAGQWLRVPSSGTLVRGAMAPGSVGAWSNRNLVAIDRPLAEVLADVRRYYDGWIVLTDDRLGAAAVTGSYDMTDPATAISYIVQPHGGVVRQISPWLIVISAK
ncbi:FecR family protein [Sphingomonas sp.]|uniref:FecR family protein n=1 Tax=Sphingomonas sp. TaxID=28214 RepID=UPI0031D787F5